MEISNQSSKIKYLFLPLAALFMFSCNTTSNHKEVMHTSDSTISVVDTLSTVVKLAVVPETFRLTSLPDSIQVILTNNTSDTITTGLYYIIETFESNEWKEISPTNIAFNDLGWQLRPKDQQSFQQSLYKKQINYQVGQYRIMKSYIKSDYRKTKDKLHVYAEFAIAK